MSERPKLPPRHRYDIEGPEDSLIMPPGWSEPCMGVIATTQLGPIRGWFAEDRTFKSVAADTKDGVVARAWLCWEQNSGMSKIEFQAMERAAVFVTEWYLTGGRRNHVVTMANAESILAALQAVRYGPQRRGEEGVDDAE